MKKLFYILTIAATLVSCSAEKRLAGFLARHPKLQHTDTLVIRDTIIIPADTAYKTISLQDILDLDSVATAQKAIQKTDTATYKPSVGVSNRESKAVLIANGNGQFTLQATTKADSIIIHDTITIPSYTTKIEYKDKIIYQMKWWQKSFFAIGVLTALLFILIIAIRLSMK